MGYDAFEPYYTRAERLFQVRGLRGADPTEPWASAPYARPPVPHEPRIQELCEALERAGHHPFPQPLAMLLEEDELGPAPHSASAIRWPGLQRSAYDPLNPALSRARPKTPPSWRAIQTVTFCG